MRINKGWGLALRKRFCRSFDFELQASADNDGIVLSLGPQHSFPNEQLFTMLNPRNIRGLIEQALLQVPLFQVRWRWNTTRSLAVLRNRGGQRVPPALQRFRADDKMTADFPAQSQWTEQVTGDIEIPDHPLVNQTVDDCLHEAIDLDGLIQVMEKIEAGDVQLIARDTREPSPFAYQLLNAYPYAFLDDAPLEERRARAVAQRRTLALDSMTDLSRLDLDAIRQVALEAWPEARSGDELHDVLEAMGAVPATDALATAGWEPLFAALVAQGRATTLCTAAGTRLWVAAESLDLARAAYGDAAAVEPAITLPARLRKTVEPEEARLRILRGYLEAKGVSDADAVAAALGLEPADVHATLPVLESQGHVVRGRYLADGIQWCERRLLMRIHKRTLDGLRRQIRPVTPEQFHGFLLRHHQVLGETRREGRQGALEALGQLAGFDAGAGAWESENIASRVKEYQPSWLDELTHSGMIAWGRLAPPVRDEDDGPMTAGMSRVVPLALMPREDLGWLLPPGRTDNGPQLALARSNAQTVHEALVKHGAQFFAELKLRTGLLEAQLEEALGELCRLGLIHADGFAAIRPFVMKSKKKPTRGQLPGRFRLAPTYAQGGRWALFPGIVEAVDPETRAERWARLLLTRYGVIFRDLLARESAAPAWGELARSCRRLEAHGEIRGGRFVEGPWGEQFALAEAVDALRKAREQGPTGEWVVLSAADPLNLLGVLTTGAKVPANRQTTMVLADGKLVATREGTEVTFHVPVSAETESAMRHALQLSGTYRTRLSPTPALFSL
jgi:ATP-dependent Lhr-like helicase